jgi:hypothetical protein
MSPRTMRHDCKPPPPWPIKGGGGPPAARGQRIAHTCTFFVFTTILAPCLNQTSGTWRHYLLSRHACRSPLQAPRCSAIQCLEHTPAGCTASAGTRIKLVSPSCLAPAIERQISALVRVSVGTTFHTDSGVITNEGATKSDHHHNHTKLWACLDPWD